MSVKEKIKQNVAQSLSKITEIRRHIHANPELSFKEFETSKYVCSILDELGIKYQNGFVETGIVAHIEGNDPTSKVVALRADMDALPILEENDVPYRSKNEGIMHACGHDVHTASLLGAAAALNEVRNDFSGTIKLIFQPGEEKLPGGASLMIKEGALEAPKAQSIIGQHVYPQLEAGKVGFKAGMYMASADEIYMTVNGKGGHAALPHDCVDPVLITSHIIIALQGIISRRLKPGSPSVLSLGKVIADGATNIIPEEVKVEGTFRAMDEEWRMTAHKLMKEMAEGIGRSMGAEVDFEVRVGYPCVMNDERLTNASFKAAQEYLGAENVVVLEPRMTGEDFSYYTHHMPGTFYRLGTSDNARGINSGVHTPTFDIDESSLEVGAGLMAWLAVSELNG